MFWQAAYAALGLGTMAFAFSFLIIVVGIKELNSKDELKAEKKE